MISWSILYSPHPRRQYYIVFVLIEPVLKLSVYALRIWINKPVIGSWAGGGTRFIIILFCQYVKYHWTTKVTHFIYFSKFSWANAVKMNALTPVKSSSNTSLKHISVQSESWKWDCRTVMAYINKGLSFISVSIPVYMKGSSGEYNCLLRFVFAMFVLKRDWVNWGMDGITCREMLQLS